MAPAVVEHSEAVTPRNEVVMCSDDSPTQGSPTTPNTTETDPTIGGIPLETAERMMDSAAAMAESAYPGSAYRGSVETTPDAPSADDPPGREFTHVISETNIPVVLTNTEWSALHWLLIEQSTMIWTVSRQQNNDAMKAEAAWWKDLELKLGACVENMTVGPIRVILKQAMQDSEVQP